MKVLCLRCAHGHDFEGWFGSEDDFLDQHGRGLVACPVCADTAVSRVPSAPRLNLSGAREAGSPALAAQPDLQRMWLQAVRHVMSSTEDVGGRFAEEARRIHYGEVASRGIRGQTTADEARALRDEGIEFASLPLPEAAKETLQ